MTTEARSRYMLLRSLACAQMAEASRLDMEAARIEGRPEMAAMWQRQAENYSATAATYRRLSDKYQADAQQEARAA